MCVRVYACEREGERERVRVRDRDYDMAMVLKIETDELVKSRTTFFKQDQFKYWCILSGIRLQNH